jgi:hypothetical protein
MLKKGEMREKVERKRVGKFPAPKIGGVRLTKFTKGNSSSFVRRLNNEATSYFSLTSRRRYWWWICEKYLLSMEEWEKSTFLTKWMYEEGGLDSQNF